jgi:hypothetical protein
MYHVFHVMCLTPLSTIFQIYRDGQFYWWRKPENPEKITKLTKAFYYKFLWFSFPAALCNVKALQVFIYLFHLTAFSNFLFTNLFSIKCLYFFIISSLFRYFNLSIFIQSYVNIKLHVSTLYSFWFVMINESMLAILLKVVLNTITLTLTPWKVLVHNLKFSLQKLLLLDYFNYVKIILK